MTQANCQTDAAPRAQRALWALAALSFAFYLVGNSQSPLFDRDEPRFAQAAREMLSTRDFVVPRLNGEVRYDKPVLAYYFMAAAMAVFGPDEFGARFPSAVFGALSVVACFLLARRMLSDERKALIAAAILAGAPVMVAESKQCTVDALLLLLLLLSFTGLWRIYEGPCHNKWKVLFWASLSLAVLTKGPVALAAVFAAVFLMTAISRDRSFLGRMAWPWGIPLFILILTPWLLAVQEKTGGEFLRVALGKHVIARSERAFEGHEGFPGFYVATLFVTFFPWAFFAPGAVWDAVRGLRNWPREIFLLSWAGGLWIVLELVRTKMVHYALPTFPALSILVAAFLVTAEARRDPRLIWGMASTLVMAVVIAVGMPVAAFLYGLHNAVEPLAAAGLVLLAGMTWCVILQRRFRPFAVAAGIITVFAWLLVLSAWALPVLAAYSPSKEAASIVAKAAREFPSRPAVGLIGFKEPSLVFYLDGARFPPAPAALEDFDAPGFPDILVVSARERSVMEFLQMSDFNYVGSVEGINFAKGGRVRLSIWSRPPPQ